MSNKDRFISWLLINVVISIMMLTYVGVITLLGIEIRHDVFWTFLAAMAVISMFSVAFLMKENNEE